jgi:hypothetical protein
MFILRHLRANGLIDFKVAQEPVKAGIARANGDDQFGLDQWNLGDETALDNFVSLEVHGTVFQPLAIRYAEVHVTMVIRA